MSFRNPVGPQPPSVYWRRRILVLLGLVAVLAAIVLIVVRPGANAAPADPTPSPAPTTETSSAPEPTAPAPTAGANAVAECAPGQVKVTAVTDKTTYAAEEVPQLSFTVENVGAAPCAINAGTSGQVFTITSGSDTIWTSTDCQTDPVDQVVTLAPGAPASSSPFGWERERSSTDTCGDAERETVAAEGASYHLTVSVGGVESAETAQFILD